MNADSFKFECPSCGQHIAVTMAQVGVRAECPACGGSLVVPEPAVASRPPLQGPSGVRIPPPKAPASRSLALGLALVTAGLLVIVAVTAYVRSGGKIGSTPFQQINVDCVLYVAAMDSGQLLANGKEVQLDELRGFLAKTKRGNGIVKFYQEKGSNKEGQPIARKALELVEGMSLPVIYSTKHDNLDPFFNGPADSVP